MAPTTTTRSFIPSPQVRTARVVGLTGLHLGLLFCLALGLQPAVASSRGSFVAERLASTESVFRLSAPPSDKEAANRRVSAQLLLRDGTWRAAQILSVDEQMFTLSGPDAVERIDRGLVVACLIGPALPHSLAFLTQLSAGSLVLDDGQLLPGSYRFDGSAAVWQHRWIGSVPIDIDRLAEIRFRADARATAEVDGDTVLLLNGDRLRGFVDSIGAEVSIEAIEQTGSGFGLARSAPTESDEPRDARREGADDASNGGQQSMDRPETRDGATASRGIPVERVAAIAFAAREPTVRGGSAVWFADGTFVRVEDIALDNRRGWVFGLSDPLFRSTREGGDGRVQASVPIAVVFDAEALLPLAACRVDGVEPPPEAYRYALDGAFRLEDPAQSLLGLGEIALDGAMQVRFLLPAPLGASGDSFVFSADVMLAEPAPPDARVEFTVRLGDRAQQRIVLDQGRPSASIGLAVAASLGGRPAAEALEIRVSDGGNGTAGDRIRLRRAAFIRQR